MNKTWIYVLSLLISSSTMAQQSLKLDDAIQSMKQNNTQLRIQQNEIDLSNNELNSSLTGFLPRLSASYTGFYTNDPLNAFGFKLQGRYVSAADFNPALLNDPKDTPNFNTKFSLQQPILNFDAYTARKALKEKIKATALQKDFAEASLSVEIKNSYTNLQFLYEAKKAIEKGIDAYKETLRNTENMQKQGFARTSDVLMVKVGLSEIENKKIEINNNIANLSDYLTWLMGKEERVIYQPSTTLQQASLATNSSDFSMKRADILAMQHGLEARSKMTTMQKSGLLPRINGFAEYNFNDRKAFNFFAKSYLVGISLSWDIFNGNQSFNKIKQSKLELSKAQNEMKLYVEKNQLALQKSNRDLLANQAKINLAETALSQANENIRILTDRYAEGLEKTADLLISQATALEKTVNHLQAIKDYNLTLIQINFLTQTEK